MLDTILLVGSAVGAMVAHAWVLGARAKAELAALLVLDCTLIFLALASGDSDRWGLWMQEDAWVEWATAYAFAAAAAIFAWRGLRGRGWTRLAGLGLAVFCFFVAGEELSWGQRLLAFEPPEIFLSHNFQQEANLHNLLTNQELAGVSLDSRFLVALVAVVYGVLGPLLLLLPARFEGPRGLAPPAVLAPCFALVAAVELDYPVKLAGEAAEWVLGLTFLFDALLRSRPWPAPRWAGVLLPISIGLALATPPVLERALFGSDAERVAQARAELAQLGEDLPQAIRPRLRNKGRVHKRLFTALQADYLDFGTTSSFLEGQASAAATEGDRRTDRKGYLLDPWSNPWWILWEDGGETRVIYSFGPNRRRDIATRPYGGPAGDDLVLEAPSGRGAP